MFLVLRRCFTTVKQVNGKGTSAESSPAWEVARKELKEKYGENATWTPKKKLPRLKINKIKILHETGQYKKQELAKLFKISYPSICKIVKSKVEYDEEDLSKKEKRIKEMENLWREQNPERKKRKKFDWRVNDLGL